MSSPNGYAVVDVDDEVGDALLALIAVTHSIRLRAVGTVIPASSFRVRRDTVLRAPDGADNCSFSLHRPGVKPQQLSSGSP